MKIRVFIGTTKLGKSKGICAIGVNNGKDHLQLPTQVLEHNNIDEEYLIISAILYFLKILKAEIKSSTEVCFYVRNEIISFVWNNEYLTDGFFASGTKHQDIWDEIIKTSNNSKIKVTIKSSDSPLVAMTKQEKKRI